MGEDQTKDDRRSVVIVQDKHTGDINPYSSIKVFVKNAQGYEDTEKQLTRLYNRLSRGKDYEDERYLVLKRKVINQPPPQ